MLISFFLFLPHKTLSHLPVFAKHLKGELLWPEAAVIPNGPPHASRYFLS